MPQFSQSYGNSAEGASWSVTIVAGVLAHVTATWRFDQAVGFARMSRSTQRESQRRNQLPVGVKPRLAQALKRGLEIAIAAQLV